MSAAVDPYTVTVDEIAAAGRAVAEAGAEQVFLDCIGYTEQHRSAVARRGPPTHTARSLAVRGAITVLREPALLGVANA